MDGFVPGAGTTLKITLVEAPNLSTLCAYNPLATAATDGTRGKSYLYDGLIGGKQPTLNPGTS